MSKKGIQVGDIVETQQGSFAQVTKIDGYLVETLPGLWWRVDDDGVLIPERGEA